MKLDITRRFKHIFVSFLLCFMAFCVWNIWNMRKLYGSKFYGSKLYQSQDPLTFKYLRKLDLTCPPAANEMKLSKLQETLESQSDGPLIPRIIHQSWRDENLPGQFAKWRESWKNCFPDWEFKFWTDKDNRNFILEHYPWFLAIYDTYTMNIKRADSVRYFYLHYYGGIYVDLDYECLRPFEHLLVKDLVFESIDLSMNLVNHRYPDNPYVQNSFMASRAGHPFWKKMWADLVRFSQLQLPDRATGPFRLMSVLKSYTKNHDDYIVYPSCYFNPFTWGTKVESCKTLNRMTDLEVQECKKSFPDAYTITYHTQSWRKGKKYLNATINTNGTN